MPSRLVDIPKLRTPSPHHSICKIKKQKKRPQERLDTDDSEMTLSDKISVLISLHQILGIGDRERQEYTSGILWSAST